jgi:hypothetical protein
MAKDIIISEKQLETLVNGVKKRNIQEHGEEVLTWQNNNYLL